MIIKVRFISNDSHDHLHKISHWKQGIVGSTQHVLLTFHFLLSYRGVAVQLCCWGILISIGESERVKNLNLTETVTFIHKNHEATMQAGTRNYVHFADRCIILLFINLYWRNHMYVPYGLKWNGIIWNYLKKSGSKIKYHHTSINSPSKSSSYLTNGWHFFISWRLLNKSVLTLEK